MRYFLLFKNQFAEKNLYLILIPDVYYTSHQEKIDARINPQQEYTVITDGGLEYNIRFNNDGTPYFKRADSYDDNPPYSDGNEHSDYKFVYNTSTVNLVTESCEDFVQIAVKVKSFDNLNDLMNCTLFVRCNNATIYNSNYQPHYQEEEFKIANLDLDRAGFY